MSQFRIVMLDETSAADRDFYQSLAGDGFVTVQAVSTDGLAIGSGGGTVLAIGDLEADRLALGLQGTSETNLAGHADHGWFVVGDSAVLMASDLEVEVLDVDITDGATVEATATQSVDGNIDESADVVLKVAGSWRPAPMPGVRRGLAM